MATHVTSVLFYLGLNCLLSGLVAENSIVNETVQSISPTSYSASILSLNFISSNAKLNRTPNISTQSQQINAQLTTKVAMSSALHSTSFSSMILQIGNQTVVSKTMLVIASQATPNVPVNKPDHRRHRTTEDVYAMAVLLTISGVCSIMLLALFVKFLVDSRKR